MESLATLTDSCTSGTHVSIPILTLLNDVNGRIEGQPSCAANWHEIRERFLLGMCWERYIQQLYMRLVEFGFLAIQIASKSTH